MDIRWNGRKKWKKGGEGGSSQKSLKRCEIIFEQPLCPSIMVEVPNVLKLLVYVKVK